MSPALAIVLFIVGVVLAVWATGRLLEGLVGLALVLRVSAFAVGAALSGLEAENVAVGLSAGRARAAPIALGTVFGGATFLVCVALGLGALLFPLKIWLPRSFLLAFAAAPVISGLALIAPTTPRWTGVVLLAAFSLLLGYLILASRGHHYLVSDDISDEVTEAREKHRSLPASIVLAVLGILVIGIGGELVAQGAIDIIAGFGVPAALMGMVITPAAIEFEEIFRQAIPSHEGRHDVSAGNLVGTLFYFVLFNLGLIALLTPVHVTSLNRALDWPFLLAVTWLAALFLWRGRVGRGAGAILLASYAIYAALHVILRG